VLDCVLWTPLAVRVGRCTTVPVRPRTPVAARPTDPPVGHRHSGARLAVARRATTPAGSGAGTHARRPPESPPSRTTVHERVGGRRPRDSRATASARSSRCTGVPPRSGDSHQRQCPATAAPARSGLGASRKTVLRGPMTDFVTSVRGLPCASANLGTADRSICLEVAHRHLGGRLLTCPGRHGLLDTESPPGEGAARAPSPGGPSPVGRGPTRADPADGRLPLPWAGSPQGRTHHPPTPRSCRPD